jgi:hypothetical protein
MKISCAQKEIQAKSHTTSSLEERIDECLEKGLHILLYVGALPVTLWIILQFFTNFL